MTSATTQAGDWHAAKMRGQRLPEHELPEEVCDLCSEPMDAPAISAAAYEATGFHVCTACLEASL